MTPVEALERRQLMSVTYGANLIVNGNAEAQTGSVSGNDIIVPTGWTVNSTPTVVKYGVDSQVPVPAPGASLFGNNFFAGGPDNSESDLFQTINLTSIASAIDTGKVKFNLAGYLGGFTDQSDNATLFANFQDATKGFLNQSFVGPVTAPDRNNSTTILSRSTTGLIPAGTRFVQIQLHFERGVGTYNDGYADNVSFVLTSPVTTGTISGFVYNDLNGNGLHDTGEAGLAGVTVFVDKDGNKKLSAGDASVVTAKDGSYAFAGLPARTYPVYVVAPSTYRITSLNPVSAAVTVGSRVTANFELSQTALISGVVFNDANGNKIHDTSEAGLSGVVVYLDFNNNGQLDSFELKTTTDAQGNFHFAVPFGTYVVREVVPTGYAQTTANPASLTLARGALSPLINFGDKHS